MPSEGSTVVVGSSPTVTSCGTNTISLSSSSGVSGESTPTAMVVDYDFVAVSGPGGGALGQLLSSNTTSAVSSIPGLPNLQNSIGGGGLPNKTAQSILHNCHPSSCPTASLTSSCSTTSTSTSPPPPLLEGVLVNGLANSMVSSNDTGSSLFSVSMLNFPII